LTRDCKRQGFKGARVPDNNVSVIIGIVGVPLVGTQKNRRRFAKTGKHKACPYSGIRV
jgi:hypothetical protein